LAITFRIFNISGSPFGVRYCAVTVFHTATKKAERLIMPLALSKQEKVFARLFQKAARIQRRGALVALRRGRNSPNGAFLFVSFFFCAYMVKRKSG